jgi:hypothetical protein
MNRTFITRGLAAIVCSAPLAPLALPAVAAAKRHHAVVVYTYTATIDCGSGPVTVLSTDDMYAPLFDPVARRSYQPVAWDIVYDGHVIQDTRPGKMPKPKHLVKCSYDDGGAVGTVTVIRPHGETADRDSDRDD